MVFPHPVSPDMRTTCFETMNSQPVLKYARNWLIQTPQLNKAGRNTTYSNQHLTQILYNKTNVTYIRNISSKSHASCNMYTGNWAQDKCKYFKITWWDSVVDVMTSRKDAIGSLDLSSLTCMHRRRETFYSVNILQQKWWLWTAESL